MSSKTAAIGARHAMGVPGWVMGASFVGFGSMIRDVDLSLWIGLASTFSAWALPGQVAMVELYGIGASVMVITIAVALTNVRLLPLTATLFPILRTPNTPRWKLYLLAHLVAVTSWAGAMTYCPRLPPEERLSYFVGYGAVLWAVSMLCTASGFYLAGSVPLPVSLSLVFLNPIYFMLILVSDLKLRGRMVAVITGAVLGPVLHMITPDWALLIAGTTAGTIAALSDRFWGHRP